MKRKWQSVKAKKHNRKRAERAIRKLQTRKDGKGSGPTHVERAIAGDGVYDFLTAPKTFSLTKNVEETAKYFADLENRLGLELPTFIDLSQVRVITPDAILCLLSIMDVSEQRGFTKIRGNKPNGSDARELIEQSGFFDFVSTREPVVHVSTKIVSIRTGELVEGDVAEEVINFACRRLNRERDPVSFRNYRAITECMGNVVQHAYKGGPDYQPKWWLLAVYDENKRCVSFSVLDYGVGIPSTVRKNILEEAERFLDSVTLRSSYRIDSSLVMSALKGEIRTRTGQHYRGKGLPSMYQNLRRGIISNLVIVSDRAYINFAKHRFTDLQNPLQGTILTWDLMEDAKME